MDKARITKLSAFDVLCGLSLLASLTFMVMWMTSYTHYTSVGVDSDRVVGDSVVQTHYRLRWPGNGSFFMGYDQYLKPASEPLELFDPGAALFQEPRRPAPQSWWNEVGFWSLSRRNPLAQVLPGVSVVPWSSWLGIPSWVPVLLTAVLPAVWWRRRRQK
jgi:hypothetical protein